ncbi:MAG TPA: hypothetical protein VFA19_16285 [Gaiellaceae bacterium]|nr:hypothetical protein [Gaiellaceae bacterium]
MGEKRSAGTRFPEEAEVLARTLEEAVVKTKATVEAAGSPKPARRSKRKQLWEYQVELVHDARRGWYQLREDREIAALGELLNLRGRDGWELVWYGPSPFATADSLPRFLAVFKRPLDTPAAAPAARPAVRTAARRR